MQKDDKTFKGERLTEDEERCLDTIAIIELAVSHLGEMHRTIPFLPPQVLEAQKVLSEFFMRFTMPKTYLQVTARAARLERIGDGLAALVEKPKPKRVPSPDATLVIPEKTSCH